MVPSPPPKKQKTPKVSVLMATYNRAHLLPHAIQSIIHQTFKDWELVIIDDASTDTTAEVVRAFIQQDPRIRYHRHKNNSGLAAARNTSFDLAQGTYITFQDDDDLSTTTRLEELNHYLDNHPHADMVTSSRHIFRQQNGFLYKKEKTFHQKKNSKTLHALIEMPAPFACYMARKHVFQTVRMRPFFRVAEDYDAFLHCSEHYTLVGLPTVLYHYRVSDPTHQTLSTGDAATHSLCWRYHCLAWTSAVHRRMRWNDPIDTAQTIDDALNHLHPEFQTHARTELKSLVEGFTLPLTMDAQPTIFEPIDAFVKALAGTETMQHLIDYTTALCLVQNLRDKRASFTQAKDPLKQDHIRQYVRTLPKFVWTEQLDYFIRDNRNKDFINLLHVARRCHKDTPLLPRTSTVLSACWHHKRFHFIALFFLYLIRAKLS
ncbi:MAG: glycosyltransferase family 2 protein [Alphaproteobacteria bacterium GM202ARS2]|nr:glycosyltransferase family 2 protein [Alphaproteobacteria bacterium GM202ARS2]